jgi:hypothetical protein
MTARPRVGVAVVALLATAAAAAAVVRVSSRPPSLTDRRRALAERLYRHGLLPSGQPLRARGPTGELAGADAACARCHRPSGMGVVEGDRIIPPIAGRFLFQRRADTVAEVESRHPRGPDLAHALGRQRARVPYDRDRLVRAIRDGVDASGRSLDALMPRYALDDGDARLLIDYLAQLSAAPSAGVTPQTIDFATVVTPDVGAVERQAMLDVVSAFFDVHNAGRELERLRARRYAGATASSARAWRLHVWQLTGPPATWDAQLVEAVRRQPVFALVSGISTQTWDPVQRFCERRALPCWFPIVDLPPFAEGDFYSVYFSEGVRLEAAILARVLATQRPRRLLLVRGDDAAAAGAVQAALERLGRDGIVAEERVVPSFDRPALGGAFAGVGATDAVMLWLRARELPRLGDVPPPSGASLYLSATLAGGERAPLPPAWKAQARLIYPFELPELRRAAMARVRAWLQTRGLPLVDERVQADAYLACVLLAEKLDEMRDLVQRDELLERAEVGLAMRAPTAMYRRLSLGPGQRFASKGGYVARFAAPTSPALLGASDWIVP